MDLPRPPHPPTTEPLEMTGPRRPPLRRSLVLVLAVGLAGCHLPGGTAPDLGPGHGRVDRTFTASLRNSVRAAIEALDDAKVHPEGGSVRTMNAVSDLGKRGWVDQTNAEFFPDNESFHDLFDEHKLNVAGKDPLYFNPVQMTYQGKLADGRPVSVIVRSQPPDATQTLVMTRVGRDGDEAWCRSYLDNVATRLAAKAKEQEQEKPQENPAPAQPAAGLPELPR